MAGIRNIASLTPYPPTIIDLVLKNVTYLRLSKSTPVRVAKALTEYVSINNVLESSE